MGGDYSLLTHLLFRNIQNNIKDATAKKKAKEKYKDFFAKWELEREDVLVSPDKAFRVLLAHGGWVIDSPSAKHKLVLHLSREEQKLLTEEFLSEIRNRHREMLTSCNNHSKE